MDLKPVPSSSKPFEYENYYIDALLGNILQPDPDPDPDPGSNSGPSGQNGDPIQPWERGPPRHGQSSAIQLYAVPQQPRDYPLAERA